MQKNNHARSKQRRKMLKLKNFFKKVFAKRFEKTLVKPKGETIEGNAKLNAKNLRVISPDNYRRYLDGSHEVNKNQRQKRKLAAQTR